jgi:BolA family transcriptional regulator, general stress-responsive regulator
MTLGPIGRRMERKLLTSLQPLRLEVIDESAQHAGHSGAHPLGESHFRVRIVAAAFAGKSRLERHRMIHDLLAEELAGRVHALAIEAHEPT